MRPVPRRASRLKISVEEFHFIDYIMHEELLCVGSRSSRAERRKLSREGIAFISYSIRLISAI